MLPDDLQPLSQIAPEVFRIKVESLHRARCRGTVKLVVYKLGRKVYASRAEAEAVAAASRR